MHEAAKFVHCNAAHAEAADEQLALAILPQARVRCSKRRRQNRRLPTIAGLCSVPRATDVTIQKNNNNINILVGAT
jgi:hypothetical protein